jgi:iron complex outermembrane recepter protein
MRINGKLSSVSRVSRLLTAFTFLAIIPAFGFAQDDKNPAAKDDSKQIAIEPVTVTVTAQKEAEPASSAPLSITAVTQEVMTNANIQAVKPAAAYAPNVFINEFSARALSNPFFRGIGGSPTNPGVSTIIDGVPHLNSYSSNIELIDVDQIEFVRGPEGALYGRNTAGGLINITSRELSNTWKAQGQIEFGNYGFWDERASISSPLLKNRFGIALAGGYSSRDGYTINDFTGSNLDSREAGFGKAQLFYRVNDRLKLRFIFSGEHNNDGDYTLGDLGSIRANPHHVSRDFEGSNHRSVGSTTLVLDYRGSAIIFSSITGGIWWRNHSITDLDCQTAMPANGNLYATNDNVEKQHQFTQEFRFASSKDKPFSMGDAVNLDWQAGIFIFNQGYQQDYARNITTFFGSFPDSLSADLGDSGVGLYGHAKVTAWKKISFIAGVRFDYEDKNADLASGGAIKSANDSFSEVSPQFSVAYRFAQNHMSYISVSRGYKAGGFNPLPSGAPMPSGAESYGAEHTWNYELGQKAKWLEGKLEATAALFYIDWQNLQLNQQIPLSGGKYFIGNAGKANSKGLEAETTYRPFSWWDLFGMVGYTHARFLSGSRAYNANRDINEGVGGKTLPFTPVFTANMGTQISWAPSGNAKLYFRVQVSNCGDFQYDASNAMGQTSYHLVNFRGGLRTKHWFAEGWADNAFDARYVPIAIPYAQLGAPSGYVGESGAPATYGVRIGVNY